MNGYPAGTCFPIPTKWTIKQKLLSFGDMHIKDEWGNSVFRAEYKFPSLMWNLNFFDLRQNDSVPIGRIEQKFRIGMPKFVISLNGMEYGQIQQKFRCLVQNFEMRTFDQRPPIRVDGDWTAHSYVFTREDGRVVARVSKEWIAMRDTYTVVVEPGEDVIFILACCIAIDKCVTKN